MLNIYSLMKSKMKKHFDQNIHFNYLMNYRLSMFDHHTSPEIAETLRESLLEGIASAQGHAGVFKYEGKYYTGVGSFTGDPFNGLPREYMINVQGIDRELRGRIGVDCVVLWNNPMLAPDSAILQTSDIMTEIDTSERVNLMFTRFLRIPKVRDSKEKKMVEEAISSIMQGKFTTVVSDSIEKILGDEPDENKFLDLVDVKEVDKLQYLSQYRANKLKEFLMMYGNNLLSTEKMAQQSTDELHGNDAVSMVLPLAMLKCRRKFCEDFRNVFQEDYSIEFSEVLAETRQEMHEDDANTKQDNEGGEADETTSVQSE